MLRDPYDYLRISMLPGIGPARGRALLAAFGAFPELLRARRGELMSVDGFHVQLSETLLSALVEERRTGAIEQATERNMASCVKHGYRFLNWDDREYPQILRGIYDPPLYLFVFGAMLEADGRSAALVGTRHPSEYGREVATQFASSLARDGVTVVSGLALGIDTVAHRGALKAGGRTIAVMGSGLRRVYPTANRELAAEIASHGCVIS